MEGKDIYTIANTEKNILMDIKAHNTTSRRILYLVLEILSVIIFFNLVGNREIIDSYKYIYLLPLSFLVVNTIFWGKITNDSFVKNLPIYIIILLIFFRNVVTPYVMLEDSFVSSLGIPSYNDATHGIILIAYETVMVYLFLYIKPRVSVRKILPLFNFNIKQRKVMFRVIFWGSILVSALALILVKEFRTQYYTIFTSDITHLVSQTANYRSGSLMRVLATGGEILISALRLVLPSVLMYKLARKDTLLRLFMCFFLVFLQCLFMNDSNAYILMLMMSQLFFVYYLFPKYRKFIIGCVFVVSFGFLALLYINRFALDHYGASWSLLLQSYIPSVANTAGVFELNSTYNIGQIFVDIFDAIPFKNFIFGDIENVKSIARIWNFENKISGQIISTIGQSYYYVGNILSPLLTCLIINFSLNIYKKIKTTDNALMLAIYIYLGIYAAAAPFVYNGLIFIQCLFQRAAFMVIIACYSNYSMNELAHWKKKSMERTESLG